jgi:hypothetical protein
MSVVWSCVAAWCAGRLLGALIDDYFVERFTDYGSGASEEERRWIKCMTEGKRYYLDLHRKMGGW